MTQIEEALTKARDLIAQGGRRFKKAREDYSVMTVKHMGRAALNKVRRLQSERRGR